MLLEGINLILVIIIGFKIGVLTVYANALVKFVGIRAFAPRSRETSQFIPNVKPGTHWQPFPVETEFSAQSVQA